MTAQQPLEMSLAEAWPPDAWRDSHVVLAVSAGPDSMAMLRAMLALKEESGGIGRLFVAHLNHRLRGQDSDADQAWLESCCRELNVPLEIGRADVQAIADKKGDGLESAARDARYEFLVQSAERVGARFVAVAHTADDQVETVLHRILRGTGLAGLAGMPSARALSPGVALVRPLLAVRRHAVLGYLDAIGQDYRLDPTNIDRRWTRNRLRHDLLPALRQRFNASVDEALLRLAVQAGESQAVIARLSASLADNTVVVHFPPQSEEGAPATRVEVNCVPLREALPIVVREVCKLAWKRANWPVQSMGFDAWQQLADVIHGTGERTARLPGNTRLRRDSNALILERLGP